MDPQTDGLDRVTREPNHPWDCLSESSGLIVTLEISILCRCLICTSGKVYWLVDSILMYCVDWERGIYCFTSGNIVALMWYYLHFYLLYVFKKLGIYDYLEVLCDSG